MLGLLLAGSSVLAVPSWPPETRFILNPKQGASIPTAVCRAQFNTPCAIEKIHQIVYDLAAAFESAATTAAFDQLVAGVNAGQYNEPVLFWPTVLNSTGHLLATGTEASASYQGPDYVGGFYPDILVAEGRQVSTSLGGVFQDSLWNDIQDAANDDGYFFTNGKDGYHENGDVSVTKTVERVNYVMKVATVRGEVYVMSAFSNMPVSDPYTQSNCTANKDALCSITNVRYVLGNVVTDLIKARDQQEVNRIFAAVSNKQYNRYYQGWATGFYPFIWGMSGLGYAHGANNQFVGSYLNSSARLNIPKLATLHADLAEAGWSGGGFTAYYWQNGDEPMYLKVSFTVGVRRFGVEYYVGVGYTHETDAVLAPVPGPHGQACNIGSNQPCAFTNVLNLVGHVQTLCFMSNMFDLDAAFNLTTNDATYFKAQPEGYSSAYRNYAFIYDYNQTNVAHGANAGLIGRRLEDIIAGVARFDGILNGTQLHHDFVAAADAGGAWVAYPWINAGDTDPYLKLAYLVKIYREGREYYLGVGLSDVPLVGTDLPCSPFFSDMCAEDWALSVAGYRMSTILKAKTHAELQTQLASTHETTAAITAGGSPYGFSSMVVSATNVLASTHWSYELTSEWLLDAGISSDTLATEAPEGRWIGPLTLRSQPDQVPSAHFLYHITLDIRDDVADGSLDGVYDKYHILVPVRHGAMPPARDADGSCAAVTCVGDSGPYEGCTDVVAYATAYASAPAVELCECKSESFVVKTTLVRWGKNFTVDWAYDTEGMGVQSNLQATNDLACEAIWMAAESTNEHYLPDGLVYFAWAINFLIYATGIFFALWTYAHRSVPMVSASQPVFLYLIVAGSLISLAAVFPLSMDHKGMEPEKVQANATTGVYPKLDAACNSVVWLYSIGFVLSFGSLFAKLWRVKRVLVNPSLRNVKISVKSLLVRIGALMLGQLVLLLLWLVLDPMYYKVEIDAVDDMGRVTESHGHCVTGEVGLGFLFVLIGFNLVLLLYGNVLVYQARSVPTKYNEGKYISFCVANNLQTTMFAVLLSLFVYDTPIAFFIIKWMAVLACDAGTLLLIFAPKMILVRNGQGMVEAKTMMTNATAADGGGGRRVSTDPHSNNSDGSNVGKSGASGGLNNIDELEELRQENLELRDQLIRIKERGLNGGGDKSRNSSEKNVFASVTPIIPSAPMQVAPYEEPK